MINTTGRSLLDKVEGRYMEIDYSGAEMQLMAQYARMTQYGEAMSAANTNEWVFHIKALRRSGWWETERTVLSTYILRDQRTGVVDTEFTNKAQNAACVFCRKVIASWKAKPRKGKQMKRWTFSLPKELKDLEVTHIKDCAIKWMWAELSKWSTGIDTTRAASIVKWRDDLRKRQKDYEGYEINGQPTLYRALLSVFDRLPHPPGSEMALNLEESLVNIAAGYARSLVDQLRLEAVERAWKKADKVAGNTKGEAQT